MEQGGAKLAKILACALLLGIAITTFHPAYRHAFLAMVRGQAAESPIWKSNANYYPDITLPEPRVTESTSTDLSTP